MKNKIESAKIGIIISAVAVRISAFSLILSAFNRHNLAVPVIMLFSMCSLLCGSIEEYFKLQKKAVAPQNVQFTPTTNY